MAGSQTTVCDATEVADISTANQRKRLTMTAAFDFATLPPEINSARMYSGAGSGPMLAAASAWNAVAAELRATAASYGSVLATLTGEDWHGPASASMMAAATPYIAWMNTTAAQAEQTAAQAEAAAGAFEAAFAETVPPALVAANRTQLTALIATNVVGQNTPAIAANEAQYAEMWAQDAMAMYAYAGASAAATQLSAFSQPEQATSARGLAAQSAAAAAAAGHQQSRLSELISSVPSALRGLASTTGSGVPSWLKNLWANWGPNANIWNTVASSGLYLPSETVAPFLGMLAMHAAQDADVAADSLAFTGGALGGPLGSATGLGGAVSAGLGKAAAIGTLSVPSSWTATAPLASPLASTLGGTPMVAPPAVAAGMPGIPLANMAGQGFGRALPQYGFRPTFVARPPAAG